MGDEIKLIDKIDAQFSVVFNNLDFFFRTTLKWIEKEKNKTEKEANRAMIVGVLWWIVLQLNSKARYETNFPYETESKNTARWTEIETTDI